MALAGMARLSTVPMAQQKAARENMVGGKATGIAWKQSDAFMYYLGSGFKFCGGTSLNYSAATSAGPQVMPGTRLVC